MIEKEAWMREITEKLRAAFGERLLFAGLQGSYRRGEADEQSDIDVVVLLDRLDADDLEAYRKLLASMPQGEKACGFVCGREELEAWPGYELFGLMRETQGYFGSLRQYLPAPARQDVWEGVRIGAANLYHAACHAQLFGQVGDWADCLRALNKQAFFIMQRLAYLESGTYCDSRAALITRLAGDEREILLAGRECETLSEPQCKAGFGRLVGWCGKILVEGRNRQAEEKQAAVVLQTERLRLRKLTQGDYGALCKILQDGEVMYAYEHAFDDAEVHDWLDRQLARYERDGFGLWAVELRASGEVIGQCGITLQDWEGRQVPEIGYLFQKAFWHKGYATEAAVACRNYAFDMLGLEEVYSIIRDTNEASQKVALRGGMRQVGSMVKRYYHMEMPHLVFSIRRDEKKPG